MSSVIQHKPTNPDSDEIDLGRLIGEIIDHKKLIIAVTGLFTFLAIFYALFATPIYQADALIQVEQKKGNSILSNLSQMLPDSQPVSAPEIVLLQSRMILGKTVDDLNLQAQVTEKYFPIFGKGWARLTGNHSGSVIVSRLYVANQAGKTPELTLTISDKNHYRITGGGYNLSGRTGEAVQANGLSLKIDSIDANKNDEFTLNYISRIDAIDELKQSFTAADQGKDTGMLNLTITNANPVLAQSELQSISENYLAQNIARQAAQDSKSLEFLERQLPEVRDQLDQAEDNLSAYRKKSDSVDLNLQARAALDQIVNVDNQLNELTFREAEVSQLFTKDHPTYIALLEKRKTLEQEKIKLNKQVSSMPATQQQVLSLSRNVESGRAVYMQLLNRQQELSIAKNSAIGNVRIIDDALTAVKPVKPKKKLVVLIGMVLGLFISLGLVLLKIFLRRGIESPEQLEEIGINVYASVPVSEWMTKQQVKGLGGRRNKQKENLSYLALDNPADLAIEAIRSLRTSLHFAMMEAQNNILMISGASPNAGKTFITTNLAAVLAQGEQRVLFIDADMRKGYSHQIFQQPLEPGLSDILAGKVEIDAALRTLGNAKFDIVSRGKTPPNPSELLMHSRFSQLLSWASDNYDIVLVDTPPILAVTDAAIIGRYVGTTLLVARFEENTAKEMEVSIKRFEQSGIHVKGCILNGVVKKASSYYGYGYSHYGYTYDDKK
ncbi:polysaccharide biosynthesis tyrosine autokinase [Rosenbergiella epipactidis]|uniref:polysaccharide biosynthesis tyrosine autokinase n=1 Tax=Rosenbergiella epipactidis TaxID=1544694 RepID=UPI00202621EC|nr:polysaccharide biosynthesis tyrosine autokinase [Rosenbergiella epipactidis]MCL9667440.1 polysaccharide biosynthesis tyrosine autokinase [Rosenbergiella epipactidis]